MRIKQGMIVNSDSGHDKNRFYVVVRADDKYAYIADGKRRKIEKPKRKSFCHLTSTQMVLDYELYQSNKKIRRILNELNSSSESVAN